jgi:hypothetical protein
MRYVHLGVGTSGEVRDGSQVPPTAATPLDSTKELALRRTRAVACFTWPTSASTWCVVFPPSAEVRLLACVLRCGDACIWLFLYAL